MEKTEITLEYLPEDTAFEPEGRAPLPFGKAILPKKAAVERPPRILRKLAAYGAFCLMGVLWGRLEVLQILHLWAWRTCPHFSEKGCCSGASFRQSASAECSMRR